MAFVTDPIGIKGEEEAAKMLEKKGYNVATAVTHKDEPDKTVIEKITGDKNNILLSTQSFDARA